VADTSERVQRQGQFGQLPERRPTRTKRRWDWVAEKGLLPKNTALSIRTSVSKILGIEGDWESVDVRRLDVDALIARFRNLSNLAPNSLATYESRFRTGLASYLAYLDNPTSYQPKGRRRSPREDKAGAKEGSAGVPTPSRQDQSPAPTHHQSGGTTLVVYPFPVRPEVFAELKLPADLTFDEATRMSAFLKALALADSDDKPMT
jgi:hypothetical protein